LFNRFKEKLSSFKEALSSKLQEKAAWNEEQAELEADKINAEASKPAKANVAAGKQAKPSNGLESTPSTNVAANAVSDNNSANSSSKPKNRFSIIDKPNPLSSSRRSSWTRRT